MSATDHAKISPAGGLYLYSNTLVGIDGLTYDVDYYDNGDRYVTPPVTGAPGGWFPAGEPVPGLEFLPGGEIGIPWWIWLGGAFVLYSATSKK